MFEGLLNWVKDRLGHNKGKPVFEMRRCSKCKVQREVKIERMEHDGSLGWFCTCPVCRDVWSNEGVPKGR
jgi:hypothetical protein